MEGHPRNDDRHMMDALYCVLRTGIHWQALPRASPLAALLSASKHLQRKQGAHQANELAGRQGEGSFVREVFMSPV